MRFRLIDAAKKDFPVQRLCKVLDVSASGYLAWKERPACRRQRDDMVLLARVRSAFALSNGTYGSPRMVHELRDNGLTIGRRRVARLMRENGSCHVWMTPADQGLCFGVAGVVGAVMSSAFGAENRIRWP
jgi:putative transposase